MPTYKSGEIASKLVAQYGLELSDYKQLGDNLRSNKPNTDNLVEIEYANQEIRFAADGMPLFGNFPNSYDRAPAEYARTYGDYPRNDSPSRVEANREGAQMNLGAARHLNAHYSATVAILAAMAKAEREKASIASDDDRPLTVQETREVLSAAEWMWSYLSYRKKNRIPKGQLPPEVALLHRAIAGVRMSFNHLYLAEGHGHTVFPGLDERIFSAENWTKEVEVKGLLVTPEKVTEEPWLVEVMAEERNERSQIELCPASSKMIRRVIDTIVEVPQDVNGLDIEATYGVAPDVLLKYGTTLERLSFARIKKDRSAAFFAKQIMDRVEKAGHLLTLETVDSIREDFGADMAKVGRESKQQRDQAFREAIELLGYDPNKFKPAPPAV